jgi:hypothetical protein
LQQRHVRKMQQHDKRCIANAYAGESTRRANKEIAPLMVASQRASRSRRASARIEATSSAGACKHNATQGISKNCTRAKSNQTNQVNPRAEKMLEHNFVIVPVDLFIDKEADLLLDIAHVLKVKAVAFLLD